MRNLILLTFSVCAPENMLNIEPFCAISAKFDKWVGLETTF